MENKKFVIITPVRNEEQFIEQTIESVAAQSVKPDQWIIVNDGSTDNTRKIIEKLLPSHPWITLVDNRDRGFTHVGLGIVESFYEGFKNIANPDKWDFLVKMDGDITLEPDYFQRLLEHFQKDEKLGIGGATCILKENDILEEEKTPIFHPIAAARMYRRACYEAIDGLARTNAWDTIDLLRARMNGWKTRRFPELKIYHYRLMSSRQGLWKGKTRTGRNLYLTGYGPLFLIGRSISRLFKKPYVIESVAVMYGYFKAMLQKEPLVVTPAERDFLREEQKRRMQGQSHTI